MSRLPLLLVGMLALALPRLACAGPLEDADTAAARRHFERGRALYDMAAYEEACGEFKEARRVLDLPAFDFNLAKCEERLEHWQVAMEGYERFLARAPNDDAAAEVRNRVDVLRARIASAAPVVTEPSGAEHAETAKQHELRLAAIGVAAATGALTAAGFGAYYSTWSSYSTERNACTNIMPCTPSDYSGLSSRVEHAQIAAGVVWGLAGVAAVSDIALWVLSARRAPSAHARAPVRVLTGAQF